MSNLLPIESLTRDAQPARSSFELAAPNPILGKTVFLRLPVSSEWSYEVNPANLRVQRDLILRDQMWVTRGAARFVAVHASGARCEVRVKIRPWNPHSGSTLKTEERIRTPSVLARLGLARTRSMRLTLRCHHTEREIEIRWKGAALAEFERLVLRCECH